MTTLKCFYVFEAAFAHSKDDNLRSKRWPLGEIYLKPLLELLRDLDVFFACFVIMWYTLLKPETKMITI